LIGVVRALYWISTVLFVIPETWNAFLMLIEAPRMTETITGLGYPIYFMKMLGCAKLLGALAILALGPGSVIKEWAYAGFTFDAVSAFASLLASGAILLVACIPLLFLAALMFSYATWRKLSSASNTASTSAAPSLPSGPIGRWPYSARNSFRLRGHA
jgi:hypothetical protein